jgi:hypothetical protein
MAYADYLAEQGDPRGEFIQVQIALEGPELSGEQYRRMRQREAELLALHEREWLGELAPHLLDAAANSGWSVRHNLPFRHRLVRGWLDSLEIRTLTPGVAQLLCDVPLALLLRRLIVHSIVFPTDEEDLDGDWISPLSQLREAGFLPALRILEMSFTPFSSSVWEEYAYGGALHDILQSAGEHLGAFIRKTHRLEELVLRNVFFDLRHLSEASLRQLRLLVLDVLPTVSLADLQALLQPSRVPNLIELYLRHSGIGDEGIDWIVRSEMLRQLKVLELSQAGISDRGARSLAACPDLRGLRHLNLQGNRLGEQGLRLLREVGIDVQLNPQGPFDFGD